MNREPVVIMTAITALIEASILAAVGFGLSWTGEQVSLVMGVVIAAGAVVSAVWTRARVSPVNKEQA